MARAVGKKAPKTLKRAAPKTRPASKAVAAAAPSKPARKPAPAKRRSAPAAPPAPPPPPRATEAERREAIAIAAEQGREKLWLEQGQPLTTTEGVTIAFAQLNRGRPHWHLLTFGLGLDGLELSMRVLKGKEELAPPAWPIALLTGLIGRVKAKTLAAETNQVLLLSQGVGPAPEPTVNTPSEPDFVGLLFTPDPELPSLVTKHDTVPVLLAVPVTRDEVRAVREWSPSGLVEVLAKVDPKLVFDLERASLLQSPRARALIEQRIEREGSSLSTLTSESSSASRTGAKITWSLPLDAVETFVSLLKGRTGHQRPFAITSPTLTVDVVNADRPSVSLDGAVLTLKLSLVGARQLRSQLRLKAGTYAFDALPDFELVVTS